ncbi:unnamed protein product [Soboliphyme baturini]|uniref:PPM-type phosphatase domain-containing protein n=1 Tax=Soboliphyme baturini TaxID=241478 RepID=A0A183IQP2_9BILA|nr:unnamed protein product [Soboliphyme baturini]
MHELESEMQFQRSFESYVAKLGDGAHLDDNLSSSNGNGISVRCPSTSVNSEEAPAEGLRIALQHFSQSFNLCDALWLAAEVFGKYALPHVLLWYGSDEERTKGDDKMLPQTTFYPSVTKNHSIHEIDSMVFHKRVIAELRNVLLEVKDAIVSHYSVSPPTCRMIFSSESARNRRRKLEDRITAIPRLSVLYPNKMWVEVFSVFKGAAVFALLLAFRRRLNQRHDQTWILLEKNFGDLSVFCIFDGHAGSECAAYMSTHLVSHICTSKFFPADLCKAMNEGFSSVDRTFLEKCQRENIKSGCTAICALVTASNISLAWVGDCAAVVIDRFHNSSLLTRAHNVENSKERARIENSGGFIINVQGEYRVNGWINVTRSFGDITIKPPLIVEPDTTTFSIGDEHMFLVLGSDGFWDGVSPTKCAQLVSDFLLNLSDSSGKTYLR